MKVKEEIDSYIATQPEPKRTDLDQLHHTKATLVGLRVHPSFMR